MWRAILLMLCLGGSSFAISLNANTVFNYNELKREKLQFSSLYDKTKPSTRVDINISDNDGNDSPYRLPNTTKPFHYNVWWKINISPPILTFSGTVDIDLRATQPNVKEIVIHTLNLTIDSVKLQLDENTIAQTHSFDLVHDFLIISLESGSLMYDAEKPLNYKLSIAFNAPLRTDLYGIYRSWFLSFGKIHWMATTQFEPTFARAAFPCYDEPAYKATFDLTITRQQNFKSWSNMIRKENRTSNYVGYVDDVYHTSPEMSTYLVALIVAEYDAKTVVKKVNGTNEVVYEVIARPEAMRTGQGDYMFDLGQQILKELEKYTNIDYYSVQKFMKLTHAAIPDFDLGAMENWGLLTYREADLMYDEESSITFQKELTTRQVTHESSHQWFGNLVTMDWWDATWLNEGFATFFEYYITDKLTTMGYATRFITEKVEYALRLDSDDNPTPLTNTGVATPDEIMNMFSDITYTKGGSVIRMTDHLLGSRIHKQGLQEYLQARAYQTARPIDLFESLHKVALETGAIANYGSNFSVVDYYKTWTEQGGHPILTVNVDRQNRSVTIRQRQFNVKSGYSTPKMNWIIPITFATARHPNFSKTKPTYIIKDENTTLPISLKANEWIVFNIQQTGFYRINYDHDSWDLIISILRGPNRELIHEYNRAQIVDDALQFARAGILTYNRALNIISFMKNETAYAPWQAARRGFNWIYSSLLGTPLGDSVKHLYLSWVSNVMKEITYLPIEGEPFMRAHLRASLAPIICYYGGEECIATSRRLFADFYAYGTELPASIRSWAYCNALRAGNASYYNFLFNRYMYHPVNDEQITIVEVLGCASDEPSLFSFLDSIFKQNFVVRQQDLDDAFSNLVNNNRGNAYIVFKYVKDNLQDVVKRFKSIEDPLSTIASAFSSESDVEEFQDWATQNKELLGDSYQVLFDAAGSFKNRFTFEDSVRDDITSYLNEGDTPVGHSMA